MGAPVPRSPARASLIEKSPGLLDDINEEEKQSPALDGQFQIFSRRGRKPFFLSC